MRSLFRVLAAVVVSAAALVAIPTVGQAGPIPHDNLVSANPPLVTPHVLDGDVWAIAEVGNKIVIGGNFTRAQNPSGGTELVRNNLLAFDKNTGIIDPNFNPSPDRTVRTLVAAPDGNSVYVGGQFNNISGQQAFKLARLDINTGARISAFNPGLIDAVIWDAQLVQGTLYIAGQFDTVKGVSRSKLAALNPQNGNVLPDIDVTFAGVHRSGATHVRKIEVTPDASRLVAMGNFRTINGQDRVQLGMLNLTTSPASVANWRTARYSPNCASGFAFYTYGLDMSPDGSYFVVGTTGAYAGGPPNLCDTVARWETFATGSTIDPTWVAYSGGDSVYSVEATSSAIYVGGHFRWFNNPFCGDRECAGAVEREGIAALDPVNGVPLSWNPGRDRGRGVFAFLATDNGLYVGSDTDRIARFLFRGRIAFFPLAGGKSVPQPTPPSLPADVHLLGTGQGVVDTRYLYRINAGGPTISSADSGPDWITDTTSPGSTYRTTGSNVATYGGVPSTTGVPATTPVDLYSTERWDPSAAPAMQWTFPVPSGRNVEVRLYLANRCTCTQNVGQRLFNVTVEGTPRLTNYDIVADVGHDVGTMKSWQVVSDGAININFAHVVENPLVNGIEIVDLDAPPPSGGTDPAFKRSFDGTTVGPTTSLPSTGIPWDSVRGAFYADDRLFATWSNGTWTERSFDGTSFGSSTTIDLNGLGDAASDAQAMTGLFYENGRVYFTRSGSSSLFMRYFTAESSIVGAQRFTVTGNITGVNWSNVRGMFLSDGHLYWVNASNGTLNRLQWVNGAPVAGTNTVVSGPALDGNDWRFRALFAYGGPPPPPNQAPTASFTVTCEQLECSFDGSASSDPDGSIVNYSWNFGDGTSGSGETVSREYSSAGSYTVTLTVRDDDNATNSTNQSIVVSDATPGEITFVGSAVDGVSTTTTNHSVVVPGSVQAGDLMVLTVSTNSATATLTNPSGWQREESAASTSANTVVWTKIATGSDASSTVTSTSNAFVRGSAVLAAYRGASSADIALANETSSSATHTTPTIASSPGSWVVSYWMDKTASTTSWTPPASVQVRETGAQTGAGHLSWLLTDSGGPVPGGTAGGLSATADSSTANAIMGTYVLSASGTQDPDPPDPDPDPDPPDPDPDPSDVEFVDVSANTAQLTTTSRSVTVPSAVEADDTLLLFGTFNGVAGTVSDPSGWTRLGVATTTSHRTVAWTRTATSSDAGSSVAVTNSDLMKADVVLAAYRGAEIQTNGFAIAGQTSSTSSHTTPSVNVSSSGSWVVSYWADKSASTSSWTPPSGVEVRHTAAGTGAGHLSELLADSNGGVSAGAAGGLTATANSATANAAMATVVLEAAG